MAVGHGAGSGHSGGSMCQLWLPGVGLGPGVWCRTRREVLRGHGEWLGEWPQFREFPLAMAVWRREWPRGVAQSQWGAWCGEQPWQGESPAGCGCLACVLALWCGVEHVGRCDVWLPGWVARGERLLAAATWHAVWSWGVAQGVGGVAYWKVLQSVGAAHTSLPTLCSTLWPHAMPWLPPPLMDASHVPAWLVPLPCLAVRSTAWS